ncbi:hypothetical protein PQX77_003645 [Marasmius sp. AFHP31]|nr:hypothetical protein PQX77_003645 [Marasmius sp. AFHP31]
MIPSQLFWSATVRPNMAVTVTPARSSLRVTNAALGGNINNFTSRTTLIVRTSMEDVKMAVTSFMVGRLESCSLNLCLPEGTSYTFEVNGANSIDIVGFYEKATKTKTSETSNKRKRDQEGDPEDTERQPKQRRQDEAPNRPPAVDVPVSPVAGPSRNTNRQRGDQQRDQRGKSNTNKRGRSDDSDEEQGDQRGERDRPKKRGKNDDSDEEQARPTKR